MTPHDRAWSVRALLALAWLAGCMPASAPLPAGAQASPHPGPTPALEVWAFHAPWDPASAASAVSNRARIDVLVSGWVALDTADGRPLVLYTDTLARRGDARTRYAALVTSWLGDRFHPRTVNGLADDAPTLAHTASTIARHAEERGYSALVLDFELHEPNDLERVVRVADAIADSARARGVREIVLAIPAVDSAYPPGALLAVVDFVLPMLYDEHWSTSEPGPVASPRWVRAALQARVAEAGAARVIAALPLYGYLWRRGASAAETIGLADARRVAAEQRVPLERDAASATLTARAEGAGELWVADSELLGELLIAVRASGVRRVALWRLGTEDPEVWRLFPR